MKFLRGTPKILLVSSKAKHERACLIQMTRRQLIDGQRSEDASQPERTLFASSRDPDTATFGLALRQQSGELPPLQRFVVHPKLRKEFTFQKIAETLEIVPNIAAIGYSLELAKIREQIGQLYNEILS